MRLSLFPTRLRSLADEQLMLRVANRDDDKAFDELYRRHAQRLMGFLFRQMRQNATLAADLTQDSFMRVWSYRERWRSDSEFLPWLYSIAYNLCKNEFRHRDYQMEYEQYLANNFDDEQNADAEILLDNESFDRALQDALLALPPKARTLFSLRFEEEMTVSQIAVVMGIPQGTVKSRLHTLTKFLKNKIKQYDTI